MAHLVLVGMMGVGKSSVGRRLSNRLGRPFVDVDKVIEERQGRTIPEIFAADGEAAFRAIESAMVAEVMAAPEASVVAFGGGAVLDAGNRERAREAGVVVWLQATPKDLARRVSGGQTVRPLLTGPRPATEVIAELLATREDAYRAAAHHCIETSGRSPGAVATAVIAAAGLTEVQAVKKQRSGP